MPSSFSGKLDITPDDPRWIGAWWGGFLLCGALLFLSALFMFGFPQALDEQDMDVGAESEQAMLPSSLSMEYQGSKPKAAIHGFDINSGLSVCEHLRGEMEKFKNSTVMTLKGTRVISFPAYCCLLFCLSFLFFFAYPPLLQ